MDLELDFEPEALEMLPTEEGLTGSGPPICWLTALQPIIDPAG